MSPRLPGCRADPWYCYRVDLDAVQPPHRAGAEAGGIRIHEVLTVRFRGGDR